MRILVIDDEEDICAIIASMLTHNGDYVQTATNGDDAFCLYTDALSEGSPFDFVLTGLLQPGMNGMELVEAILKKKPTQRWGFCTGSPCVGYPVLRKPFD